MTTPITTPDAGRATTRQPRGREAERILAAEQLAELRALRQIMTEQAARLSGRIVNNVLAVRTDTFPTAGLLVLDYGAAAGAVQVTNPSAANTITVYGAQDNSGVAPATGTGVYLVPPGQTITVPIASHVVTLYGTAADRVSYAVYTGAVGPSS